MLAVSVKWISVNVNMFAIYYLSITDSSVVTVIEGLLYMYIDSMQPYCLLEAYFNSAVLVYTPMLGNVA